MSDDYLVQELEMEYNFFNFLLTFHLMEAV